MKRSFETKYKSNWHCVVGKLQSLCGLIFIINNGSYFRSQFRRTRYPRNWQIHLFPYWTEGLPHLVNPNMNAIARKIIQGRVYGRQA